MVRIVLGCLLILFFLMGLGGVYVDDGRDLGSYLLGGLVLLIAPGTALIYFGYRARKRTQAVSLPSSKPTAASVPTQLPQPAAQNSKWRPAKAASQQLASRRDERLPRIEARHLRKRFVLIEKESGPGGISFNEAIQALNRRESDNAFGLFEKSLMLGLLPSYECYAYSQLGIIHTEKGDLGPAIDCFLKCLANESVTGDAAWNAATYLYNIYSEAGVYEDANALRAVADAANTRGIYLSGETENQIRVSTREWLTKKKAESSETTPLHTSRDQLLRCAETILIIAEKPDYIGIRPGVGARGLIIIKGSLEGVTSNLCAAAKALELGVGMDGQPISESEVVSGLRRMVGDLWGDHRFRDYMKANLSLSDYQLLCESFANLNRCINSMAGPS